MANIPTFQASTSAGGSTTSLTQAWPTHLVDDVALLFMETANEDIVLTTAAGFVECGSSPQGGGTGGGATATRLTVYWCRATVTNQASVVIADAGDHVGAELITVRGVNVNISPPFQATAGDAQGTSVTGVTMPTITCTSADALLVGGAAHLTDTAAAQFSGWTSTNTALSANLTEQFDGGWTAGNGGGLAVITTNLGAGNTGAIDITAVLANASKQSRWMGLLWAATITATAVILTQSSHSMVAAADPRQPGDIILTQASHSLDATASVSTSTITTTISLSQSVHSLDVVADAEVGFVSDLSFTNVALEGVGSPHGTADTILTLTSHSLAGVGSPHATADATLTLTSHSLAGVGTPHATADATLTLASHSLTATATQTMTTATATITLTQSPHAIAAIADDDITLFEDIECSTQLGQPYGCYEFFDGTTYWRYTSADHDVVYTGNTFTAAAIFHDAIRESMEDTGGAATVHMARDLGVITQFVDSSSPAPVWLKIWSSHFVGTVTVETLLTWHGRVSLVDFSAGEAVAQCLPAQRALRHKVPRWTCQATCNNALYDANCKVNETALLITATVATVLGTTLILTAASSPATASHYLKVGVLRFAGYKTMILTHLNNESGNIVLTLMRVPVGLIVGSVVTVSPGCDRDIVTCKAKFNNVANFRGFPYVPKQNPFKHGVEN